MIKTACRFSLLALVFAASSPGIGQTVEDAVYKVLDTNPTVQRAKAEWKSERASINEARGDYLPQLDILAGAGREYTSSPATPSAENREELDRYEAGLNFRQLIYDGWKTPNEIDRRHYASEAARWEYVSVAEKTAFDVVEAYKDVLRQQMILALSRENLRSHERVYESIKLRSDRGASSESELLQASGRLSVSQASVLSAVNNLQDAQAAFIRLVGEKPNALESQGAPVQFLPANLDSAVNIAVAEHPTLKAAEFDTRQANSAHSSLKGDFLPEFAFEVERSWNRNIDGVEGRNEDLTAMVRMRMNILNGGSDKAKRMVTASEIEVAKEIKANTHRQVMEEVQLAWNAYSALDAQIPHLENHEKRVRKVVDAYYKQFSIGKRSLLDVLDTEVEVFSAATRRVNAEVDRDVAVYRILRAMGSLLTSMQVPASSLGDRSVEEMRSEKAKQADAKVDAQPEQPKETADTSSVKS